MEDGDTDEIEPLATTQSELIEYDDGTVEIVVKRATPKKGATDIQELIELVKKAL